MTTTELVQAAKEKRVNFGGNVAINGNWNGKRYERMYVHYADADGVHACKKGKEEYLDGIAPFDFDELSEQEYEKLIADIIE